MSEADTKPSFLARLFDPRGRISPGQFWVSAGISVLLLPFAFLFVAMASDPRGTDGPLLLALPLLAASLWVMAIAIVKRVRDAGRAVWIALPLMLSLIALPILGLILIWDVWPIAVLGTFGLLALISHLGRTDRNERPPHDAS
jgi:uncharacterized membrane protein YhaH (DUF805 family)